MTNSRQKGKRGERAWRDELRDAGFVKAHRGQQYQGSPDSPDVICPELPQFHFEVKFTQRLDLYGAVLQAKQDAGENKIPVIAHKKNNCEWLAIMPANFFFRMVKNGGYAQPAVCPQCNSAHIVKYGFDEKTFQRYKCQECKKVFS